MAIVTMRCLRFLLLLLLAAAMASTARANLANIVQPSKYCVMQRLEKMLTYNCLDLRLKDVPQYMSSGVEILGLSENRLRDLTIDSFRKYTGLKMLYLSDNMIQTVETGTFAQLGMLEVIDLSTNALTTLPLELFHLNNLRTLYVADNNLFHLEADLQGLRTPIAAPISTMSFASCKLQAIPNLGVLPYLQHVNYSFNPMANIDPIQLAPLCSLKTIDLRATAMRGCACKGVESHLRAAGVFVKNGPLLCDKDGPVCPPPTATNATEEIHLSCMANKQARVQEELKSSILLYAAIGGGCLLVVLLFCCCCIRNRKISAQRKKEKKAAAARRRARHMEDKHRLMIKAEQESTEEKGTNSDSNVIRVEIEKVPPAYQ